MILPTGIATTSYVLITPGTGELLLSPVPTMAYSVPGMGIPTSTIIILSSIAARLALFELGRR